MTGPVYPVRGAQATVHANGIRVASRGMATAAASARWVPLTAEQIAHLPETAGVLEIATLVRNIVFIGLASGNLRAAATQMLGIPGRLPTVAGGLYVRTFDAENEDEILTQRLNEFAALHHGELPSVNRHTARLLTAAKSQPHAA